MKPHQVLEIGGLLLTLIAIAWELFFTISLEDIEQGIKTGHIHYKLDQLHYRQLQLQRHLDYKFSEIESGNLTPVPGDRLSDKWNNYSPADSLEFVARQSRIFRRIKVSLFIIGSCFLIFAKVVDYSGQAPAIPPSAPVHTPGQPTPP